MATRKKADPPKSEEAVAVEATIIEKDVEKAGGSDMIERFEAWLVVARADADELASRHEVSEIRDEAGYAEAKKARTEVRRLRDDIDSARKAQLREIESVLKAFKDQVKDAIAPLDELDRGYKAALDAYDAAKRYERGLELAKAYEDMAPALADMLPYFRLAELADPEGRWLMRTVSDEKARELMEGAAQRVVADYETIGSLPLDEDAKVEVRAEYFRSLDLGAAMRRADEIRIERERIAAFEAERRAAEEAARAEAEKELDEAAEFVRELCPVPEPSAPAPEPMPAPEPVPAPGPAIHPPVRADEAVSWATGSDPNPQPKVEGTPDRMDVTIAYPGEIGGAYLLVAVCTEAQKDELVPACKSAGAKGRFVPTRGRRTARIEIPERS